MKNTQTTIVAVTLDKSSYEKRKEELGGFSPVFFDDKVKLDLMINETTEDITEDIAKIAKLAEMRFPLTVKDEELATLSDILSRKMSRLHELRSQINRILYISGLQHIYDL